MNSFDPSGYSRGCKHRTAIEFPFCSLPILFVRGARPGKTLVTTAAVHGDEYEGTRAIFEVFDALEPATMRGDWIAVPATNVPAFWSATRTSPLDDGNLARLFPGKPDGMPTEVIAYHTGIQLIARADFYLDLHSGGIGWAMPSMAGYDAGDPRSREAALVFGAEVIWGHSTIMEGRTVSFAKSRKIPFLYTEARGSGHPHPGDVAMMARGIRNLMRHLGILREAMERVPLRLHLIGDGNIHNGMKAPAKGFFIPAVELLDRVEEGQHLGRLCDLHGKVTAEFKAPRAGIIGLVRQLPVVQAGDPLFLITGLL